MEGQKETLKGPEGDLFFFIKEGERVGETEAEKGSCRLGKGQPF